MFCIRHELNVILIQTLHLVPMYNVSFVQSNMQYALYQLQPVRDQLLVHVYRSCPQVECTSIIQLARSSVMHTLKGGAWG